MRAKSINPIIHVFFHGFTNQKLPNSKTQKFQYFSYNLSVDLSTGITNIPALICCPDYFSLAVRVTARPTIVKVAAPITIAARSNIIAIGLFSEGVNVFRSP